MDKRNFLKTAGIAGLAAVIPYGKLFAGQGSGKGGDGNEKADCTLIPSETTGPYPLDLSSNSSMFRTIINESEVGVLHTITLKIISTTDCLPIQNARVDLWHCNAHGYYSGYDGQPGYLGTQNNAGDTWCRGIQMTDANGEVQFTTIFPGWYTSRVCHIHFQVYLSSVLQVTSQFAFPDSTKNAIYTANTPYSAHGTDPINVDDDTIFSDGHDYQMATLTLNTNGDGYDSYLEVAIDASSTTGLQSLEPETGGQFKLGQNYPNPVTDHTTIPFTLLSLSDVKIELFDMMGRKAATVTALQLSPGNQVIEIDFNSLGIECGNYIYQIEVTNSVGSFRQCKMMSKQK